MINTTYLPRLPVMPDDWGGRILLVLCFLLWATISSGVLVKLEPTLINTRQPNVIMWLFIFSSALAALRAYDKTAGRNSLWAEVSAPFEFLWQFGMGLIPALVVTGLAILILQDEKIRVRLKKDRTTGTVPKSKFDSETMEKL